VKGDPGGVRSGVLVGACEAADAVLYMNCSVRSLDSFIFFHIKGISIQESTTGVFGNEPTCVRISRTSLNDIDVLANLLWSSMTTLLLCSSTCFWPWTALFLFLTYAWSDAMDLLMWAISCFMMNVNSCKCKLSGSQDNFITERSRWFLPVDHRKESFSWPLGIKG